MNGDAPELRQHLKAMPLKFEKIQPARAYRLVSDSLRKRIMDGSLAQGDMLPPELGLAAAFGVHRSTIREALRELEQEGLLRRDGKKLMVSMPRTSELAHSAERALRLQQVSYLHVWQVALVLEPLCAALAADAISADELQALERNLERTEIIVSRGESPVEVDIEFQNLVAEAAHNPALLLGRGPISLLMRAGYASIAPQLPQSGARLLEVHRQVVAALRRRDAHAAQTWMQRHIHDYKRGCEFVGLDMQQPIPLAD